MSYFCIFFFLIIGLSLYSRDKTFFSPAVSFTFLFVIILFVIIYIFFCVIVLNIIRITSAILDIDCIVFHLE